MNSTFKRVLFKTIIKLFRIKLVNPECESETPVLMCSNHMSLLDPVAIITTMKHEIKFMAKKELFKIPLVGWVIKVFGAFPVNRGGADLNAMKTAIGLLKNGNYVGMFPQGTRYKGENPKNTKPKNGAGMLAARAKCDIQPVAIIMKNNKFCLFRRIYVVLGDVIKYETLGIEENNREEFDKATKIIFEEICVLHEKYSYLVNTKK